MTRACSPCVAYAATMARLGLPEYQAQPARFRVTWPPRGPFYDQLFDRCASTIVWACAVHVRWALWPVQLIVALWVETEDLSKPAPATSSWLEAAILAKQDRMGGRLSHRSTMYGAWPGESLAAVIAAYRETGTYAAAGRLLDKRAIPTRSGRPWSSSTVQVFVERATLQGL